MIVDPPKPPSALRLMAHIPTPRDWEVLKSLSDQSWYAEMMIVENSVPGPILCGFTHARGMYLMCGDHLFWQSYGGVQRG